MHHGTRCCNILQNWLFQLEIPFSNELHSNRRLRDYCATPVKMQCAGSGFNPCKPACYAISNTFLVQGKDRTSSVIEIFSSVINFTQRRVPCQKCLLQNYAAISRFVARMAQCW